MHRLQWLLTVLGLAGLATGAAPAWAAPGEPEDRATAPLSRKDIDLRVHDTLRDALTDGANLYNAQHYTASAYLFQGALMAVEPLFDHRFPVQEAIRKGLAEARRTSSMERRAWVLHDVIVNVRIALQPVMPGPAMGEGKTVWDRLGGEEGVTKIVDDFIEEAATDPKVDFFRTGRFKMTPAQLTRLKRHMVTLASAVARGPLKYEGRSMKEIHKGMGITDAEFDTLVAKLKMALLRNGAKQKDTEAVLEMIATTRTDIVGPGVPLPGPGPASLWDRLGGEDGVTKIVGEFIDDAVSDPKVDFFRKGRFAQTPAQLAQLKRHTVTLASLVAGGPLKYEGRSMKETHRGMGITDAEYDLLASKLKIAMLKNRIKPEDAALILKAIELKRNDIVEVKTGQAPAPPVMERPAAASADEGLRRALEAAARKPAAASDNDFPGGWALYILRALYGIPP